MKLDFEKLDVEFSDDFYGLYVVYDNTTKVDISGVITAPNDLVAVGSFVDFVKNQKDKMKPYSEYILRRVGMFKRDVLNICDYEHFDILSSRENYEEYYDSLCNYYNKLHEE